MGEINMLFAPYVTSLSLSLSLWCMRSGLHIGIGMPMFGGFGMPMMVLNLLALLVHKVQILTHTTLLALRHACDGPQFTCTTGIKAQVLTQAPDIQPFGGGFGMPMMGVGFGINPFKLVGTIFLVGALSAMCLFLFVGSGGRRGRY